MPPIPRWVDSGPVTIDADLLLTIEEAVRIEEAPAPDTVASLIARVNAERDAGRDPEHNEQLVSDTRAALDGCWLTLWEVHAIQQLRGPHAEPHGMIEVSGKWLGHARNVLDSLTLSLTGECDTTLSELDYPGAADIRKAVKASLKKDGTCGECDWCRALHLRDECDRVLDAAGHEGGVYHRVYALGQTPAEAAAAAYRDVRAGSSKED